MESFKQSFSTFLEEGDPEAFLSLGNDGLDNLSQISLYEYSRITQKHLLALIKSLFLKNPDLNSPNPYFAGQFLTHIATKAPEKFFDKEILQESLGFLDNYDINPTSCGYFYQFLKPIISRKNKILKDFFLDSKNIEVLSQNLMSSSIAELVKDLIHNYYETCDDLLTNLLQMTIGTNLDTATICIEIIVNSIPTINPCLLNRIFTIPWLSKLVTSNAKYGKYPLMIVCEILKLPRETQATNFAVRTVSDNISNLCDLLGSGIANENKIIIINAIGLSLKLNLGTVQVDVGKSRFVKLCSRIFFEDMWNSMLHGVCFQAISTIIMSRSNYLLESFFEAGIVQELVENAKTPMAQYKKSQFRKGFMGYITKIGCLLKDHVVEYVKDNLRLVSGWDGFVVYITNQETIENSILGGRTRYRHLTADDYKYLNVDNHENTENKAQYQDYSYWSLPIPEI